MKSVIQTEKKCFICGCEVNLEDHHVFFGTSNRKNSEKYGMKVWLCHMHHTGSNHSVHHDRETDLFVKRSAQLTFELDHTREEFRAIFGKSYL